MKQAGAILFLLCFLLMAFSKGLLLLNFYANQEAIIAKYCVNKNKPKLHCDGKCYLAKQIKEQEKREAGAAIMELAKIEVVSTMSFHTNIIPPAAKELSIENQLYITPYPPNPLTASVFKPPCA
ncbi:MAG: hypothetical protein ACK5NK_12590 [Niabella sp.]